MYAIPHLPVPLGTVLSLTSATLQNGVMTWGTVQAGAFNEYQALGTVTFHNASSASITVAVRINGTNTVWTHTYVATDGLSQEVTIQTTNASEATQVESGAMSNGAPVSGDAVTLTGTGSSN